jgi:hypothetical protein
MNCLEFRRDALADPRRLEAETAKHAEECVPCKEFLVRALEDEARLAQALRVRVPEGLRARLLERTAAARRSRGIYALAASLLVAVAIVLALGWPRNDPLALAGIDFVVFEEAQAILEAKPADPDQLRRVAAQLGIALPAQLGDLRYVGPCPFQGSTGQHAVVKTAFGKATLMLLPGRPIEARAVAAARGLQAVVVPAKDGSVAIISGSSQSLAHVEMLLKSI